MSFVWFPDYWLTFVLLSVPAELYGGECLPCFATVDPRRQIENHYSNVVDQRQSQSRRLKRVIDSNLIGMSTPAPQLRRTTMDSSSSNGSDNTHKIILEWANNASNTSSDEFEGAINTLVEMIKLLEQLGTGYEEMLTQKRLQLLALYEQSLNNKLKK